MKFDIKIKKEVRSSVKYIDISWPITSEITAYKNKKTVAVVPLKSFVSDKVRESAVSLNVHTGTHIDAPAHFLENGNSIGSVDLNAFVGQCRVIDLSDVECVIAVKDLQMKNIKKNERILLKTRNSLLKNTALFNPNFVYLSLQAAEYLVEKKITAVGIDYLGIERAQPRHETHTVLFKNSIGIIEGLRLKDVKEGQYFLCCLPLAFKDLEASPARAVLLELQKTTLAD